MVLETLLVKLWDSYFGDYMILSFAVLLSLERKHIIKKLPEVVPNFFARYFSISMTSTY